MSDDRTHLKLVIRKLAHGCLKIYLRLRSKPLVLVAPPATTLIVAPHPDDEALGCGALIHTRRAAGQSVHILYVTDGSGSHPNHPRITPAQLASLRKNEATRAMAELGLKADGLHFAEAPDGRLKHLTASEETSLLSHIRSILEFVAPTEVFIPYRHDGSSEHEAAFVLMGKALSRLEKRPRLFEFPVWSWWSPRLLFRATREVERVYRFNASSARSLKVRAMECYQTQISPLAPDATSVLPKGFLKFFTHSAEYYFESHVDVSPPSSSPGFYG